MFTLHPLRTLRDRDEFLRVPRSIYRRDSPWIQPLDMVMKSFLDRRNPFFEDGIGQGFLLRRQGEPVGRIMAHVWRRHRRLHSERVGYFGFFECINDSRGAELLLETAADFARQHECDVLRGPFNMTGAQEAGIVVEGFENPPAIDMVYTADWYPSLLETNGFRRCLQMETRANGTIGSLDPDRIRSCPADSRITSGLRLSCLQPFARNNQMEAIREVVNASFLGNWGFVPITRKEWELQTGALLPLLDRSLVILATIQNVIVGVTLAVPDFNRVFVKTGGRLVHPASMALLRPSRLRSVVVILCAVRKQYQGLGIARLLNTELLRNMRRKGYQRLATTWIGGENTASLASTDAFGMHRMHTVAMYERTLA